MSSELLPSFHHYQKNIRFSSLCPPLRPIPNAQSFDTDTGARLLNAHACLSSEWAKSLPRMILAARRHICRSSMTEHTWRPAAMQPSEAAACRLTHPLHSGMAGAARCTRGLKCRGSISSSTTKESLKLCGFSLLEGS